MNHRKTKFRYGHYDQCSDHYDLSALLLKECLKVGESEEDGTRVLHRVYADHAFREEAIEDRYRPVGAVRKEAERRHGALLQREQRHEVFLRRER